MKMYLYLSRLCDQNNFLKLSETIVCFHCVNCLTFKRKPFIFLFFLFSSEWLILIISSCLCGKVVLCWSLLQLIEVNDETLSFHLDYHDVQIIVSCCVESRKSWNLLLSKNIFYLLKNQIKIPQPKTWKWVHHIIKCNNVQYYRDVI